MIATMIPISGDPFYIEINRVESYLYFKKPLPFDPFEKEDFSYVVSRDIIEYKLIAERTLVYQERPGRV